MQEESNSNTRATCLNCIDGRVQLPVLNWIREQYRIDFVDVVTTAGIDGVLAAQENVDEIICNVDTSININKSSKIFIVGHNDCKGNPVDEKTHHEHINESVTQMKARWPKLEIIGLWVDHHWQVKIVDK